MCEITKAENFKRANALSPVVYASVITRGRSRGDGPPPATGCYYRLASGERFKLGVKAIREVGMPRWAFEGAE